MDSPLPCLGACYPICAEWGHTSHSPKALPATAILELQML